MPKGDEDRSRIEPSRSPAPALIRPVLLYDGGCRFCRWAARVVASLDRDRALAFLSLRDEEANELMANLPDRDPLAGWLLVLPDGGERSGGAGVIAVAERLRWLAWAGRCARALRLDPLLGRLDRVVAKHKGRLSRRVPQGPGPRRFP